MVGLKLTYSFNKYLSAYYVPETIRIIKTGMLIEAYALEMKKYGWPISQLVGAWC